MQTKTKTQLEKANELWKMRESTELSLHSGISYFKDFWDEEFENLTGIQKNLVTKHYISTGDIIE